MSLTGRLTALFAVASVLIMCATSLHIYDVLARELAFREDQALQGKVELVRNLLADFESVQAVAESPKRWHEVFVGHPGLHLNLFDDNYRLLVATSTIRVPRGLLEQSVPINDTPRTVHAPLQSSGEDFRIMTAWGYVGGRADKRIFIALAHDEDETNTLLVTHLQHVVLAVVVGSLVAAGVGYWLTHHSLKPVRKIVAAAGAITASDLGRRLDIESAPQELETLVAAFNRTLERLQESFRRLSDFSSDLAHELRTPINNLLGQTQVALSHDRTAAELHEVLVSNVEEYERLARMIDDMLFLARADNAQAVLQRESVDLRDEAAKVLSYFELLCEERNIRAASVGDATVTADRSMVQRAIANLVSNAVRHAPSGGNVMVRIAPAGDAIELSVTNDGIPISEKDLERIFDRFYRVEGSRQESDTGVGLGLPIVKSIMQLHGGTVDVRSAAGHGTTFTLRFPA